MKGGGSVVSGTDCRRRPNVSCVVPAAVTVSLPMAAVTVFSAALHNRRPLSRQSCALRRPGPPAGQTLGSPQPEAPVSPISGPTLSESDSGLGPPAPAPSRRVPSVPAAARGRPAGTGTGPPGPVTSRRPPANQAIRVSSGRRPSTCTWPGAPSPFGVAAAFRVADPGAGSASCHRSAPPPSEASAGPASQGRRSFPSL